MCEIKKENLIKKTYSFSYESSRFSVENYKLYWNFVIPSDSSSLVCFLPSTENIEVLSLVFATREILIILKHKEEKYSTQITEHVFKPWYGKTYRYNIVENTLIHQYEIVIERKETGRTQSFDVSELEYLNLFQKYNSTIAEYYKKVEENDLQENKRQIGKSLSVLMDKYNVEKQIQ